MKMYNTQDADTNTKFKLAQLWKAIQYATARKISTDSHKTVINNLLDDNFNINHKVTIKCDPLLSSQLEDCTALHFSYYGVHDIDAFRILLERGVDITAKNAKGNTALHLILLSFRGSQILVQFIKSVLSVHVKHKNVVNPRNNEGLSHLHAACIINHVDSLTLFLDADATLVNQATNSDYKLYPTFTPMHFAVHFDSFEAAQILMSRGADVSAKNASGMTPLDECLKCRLKLFHSLKSKDLDEKERENYRSRLCQNEKLIKLLLDSGCDSAVGLSTLHVASTLKDLSIAENLLSQDDVDIGYAVPIESSFRPGYTAAHFAALNSIDAVNILLRHGAKIEAQDAQGKSALAMCLRYCSIQKLYDVLVSAGNWKHARLSDARTALLDFLQATASLDQFKLFLQNVAKDVSVPRELSWRGYTMLHLTVILAKDIQTNPKMAVMDDKSLVEEYTKFGHSINTQNSRGESAIHLAFRLEKKNILQLLLERLDGQEEVEDVVDQDNLSYLHVACAEENESLVEKLLRSSDPNVVYKGKNIFSSEHTFVTGTTALHIVACNGDFALAEMLLRHGADLHSMDSRNMTPIHCLMNRVSFITADMFFRSLLNDPKDCVHDKIGLSYLHVASFYGNVPVVQKLLELGSDVNADVASIEQFTTKNVLHPLRHISTCTPLHLAQANLKDELMDLLIVRGADVFAKSHNQQRDTNFRFALDHIMRRLMFILWDREDMQKSWEEKLGLTRLHIACYLKYEELIRTALNGGAVNVNAQMHKDSEIYAGCTPLHLLLTLSHKIAYNGTVGKLYRNEKQLTVGPLVQLLLDHGADVTIVDAKNDSPIHRLYKDQWYFTDGDNCKDLLMNAQRNFDVNPLGEGGMSHFHLACLMHKVHLVEKFLQQGAVDVNRPIEFLTNGYPGETPLHLTLEFYNENPHWPDVLQIVDLLLKHGADVAAKDVYGDTPLHKRAAMDSPRLNIFNKLLSHGADIKAEHLHGQTPLDKIFQKGNNDIIDFISLLKKYNYRINSWNPTNGEGYIGKMLLTHNADNIIKSPEFTELLHSPDVRNVDEMGRTVIHNAVATAIHLDNQYQSNVTSAIGKFVALGIDIDHQDISGQTALHYAARMENKAGIIALLESGADVNIIDENKMSAFSYAFERIYSGKRISSYPLDSGVMVLYQHVKKLLHLRLEVNELNQKLSESNQQIVDGMSPTTRIRYGARMRLAESFFSQIEVSKTIDVGAAFLVFSDFLSGTNGVRRYPHLFASNRNIVDNFFERFNDKEFDELGGIVKLQQRKMKARLEMIDEAFTTLRTLMGVSFPGLYEEITGYLTNSDLKNLIASTTL